jgi:hypothetical protein
MLVCPFIGLSFPYHKIMGGSEAHMLLSNVLSLVQKQM